MNMVTAVAISLLPQWVKLPLLRLLGLKIGRNVRIGLGTVLLCRSVEIDDGAVIGMACLVRADTLRMGKRSSIGNLVRIGVHSLVMKSQSTICSQNEIAGDRTDPRSRIHLGPATWILPHCYVNVARPVTLGRNVGIGGGSYLFTHGVWLSKLDGFPISYGEITIEDDVWLPWACFVMPDVTIGSRVIVGAASVVGRSLPAGVLAAGIPARVYADRTHVDLTAEQRARVLVEVSESLATRDSLRVRVEETPGADHHYINDQLALLVHKQPGVALAPPPTLNVVFGALDREAAGRAAIWSLQDYTASPYRLIASPARRWFQEARGAGIRFYPIDEDLA